jgi:hypothetical protein
MSASCRYWTDKVSNKLVIPPIPCLVHKQVASDLQHLKHPLWHRGNGYATDKTIVKQYNISDATQFFTRLLKKPYLQQVREAI